MADREGHHPRDLQIPAWIPSLRALPLDRTPPPDLAEALSSLDRATRNFARRLGETRNPDMDAAEQEAEAPEPPSAREAFETRMREAEREAREYLDHAKRRADSLVNTMVGAVELETAEMRRDAEAGIRSRWQQVEVDAERHLGEARRIADSMVSERQKRIAALSDGSPGAPKL